MTSTSLHSSSLSAVGYECQEQLLRVEFVSGETYHYFGVPQPTYLSLITAESKGGYFNQHIRSRYVYTKVACEKK